MLIKIFIIKFCCNSLIFYKKRGTLGSFFKILKINNFICVCLGLFTLTYLPAFSPVFESVFSQAALADAQSNYQKLYQNYYSKSYEQSQEQKIPYVQKNAQQNVQQNVQQSTQQSSQKNIQKTLQKSQQPPKTSKTQPLEVKPLNNKLLDVTLDENKNYISVNDEIQNKTKVISQSQRKINAIYPFDKVAANNTYPGYRGPNQLVIYTSGFSKTTQTNEFGKEAVVVDDTVIALSGANSIIPKNGFVISGHGSAKKWISDNLKIGTKIEIQGRTILAYTTIDSYRYFAKAKIKEVEDILISTKSDYESRDDKFIYYYLRKAKQQYKKSKKDDSETSLNCAKESIQNASLAYQYTLPYIEEELKGVWLRPDKARSLKDIQLTLDKIKDAGINNVFLETYYHGKTIFPSQTMEKYGFEVQNPIYSGFDPLAIWIKEAHRRNIKIHVWFESFYVGNESPSANPKSILSQKPLWMNRTKQKADYKGYVSHPQEHNGYFLDPANPEVTEFLLTLINEIATRYNIDGLNIDYVRYPNISQENYNNQWGYTKYARDEFMGIYDIDPVDIEARGPKWGEWCDYRRSKITSYIENVSKLLRHREVVFSAVIFPDYKISVQTKFQDWDYWLNRRYLDAVTPLILTADEALANSMLDEIRKKAYRSANVYPGLFAGFIESDPEDLLRQIHIVRKLKLNGVVLFDWAHLNDNYLKVLKTSAFKEQTY